MKACIVTCFESNEQRASLVRDVFLSLGYDADLFTTDFSHLKKRIRINIPQEYISIKTKPYKKNLSVERMKSHCEFSKAAFVLIERRLPDIIYVIAPCNSLIKEAYKYKKKYPLVKIVIDMIDMWPESLPYKFSKNIFPLNIWKNLRKNYIRCADKVIVECDLYKDILSKEFDGDISTLYWSKESNIKNRKSLDYDEFNLVYLGSINNIIDISSIKKIISNMDKKVVLHIIGDGEKRKKMISSLNKVCEVVYHGVVRNEEEKSRIMSSCHAGINMYKKGLYIGLTVKCIDYFENGLPIINNIIGDTWNMVKNNKIGINVDDTYRVDTKEIIQLRKDSNRIRKFFDNNFSKDVFISNCSNIISEVMK